MCSAFTFDFNRRYQSIVSVSWLLRILLTLVDNLIMCDVIVSLFLYLGSFFDLWGKKTKQKTENTFHPPFPWIFMSKCHCAFSHQPLQSGHRSQRAPERWLPPPCTERRQRTAQSPAAWTGLYRPWTFWRSWLPSLGSASASPLWPEEQAGLETHCYTLHYDASPYNQFCCHCCFFFNINSHPITYWFD